MENRSSKHAVLYFEPGATEAMKDLAGQIRGEGGKTTLIWAKQWKGAENLIPEARAVIIQKGCANEEKIVEAYRKYGVDVEIHFVNQDGVGIDVEEEEATHAAIEEETPEPVQEEEADDSEADTSRHVKHRTFHGKAADDGNGQYHRVKNSVRNRNYFDKEPISIKSHEQHENVGHNQSRKNSINNFRIIPE